MGFIEGRAISFGKKGVADRIGILPTGTFLAIESKIGKGKLSKEQREFRDEVLSRNAVFLEVRSVEQLYMEMENLNVKSTRKKAFQPKKG